MIPSGTLVTLKISKHAECPPGILDCFAEIISNLYGRSISIVEQFSGNELAMIGAMERENERPKIPSVHRLASQEELRQRAQAVNLQIRTCGLQTQNVDKGFDRFITHFKPQKAIAATVWVETGFDSECGWAVFILSSCSYNRLAEEVTEDTTWDAVSTLANCELVSNRPKEHEAMPFFPEEYTHVFDQACK
jgi:hypothetical protein